MPPAFYTVLEVLSNRGPDNPIFLRYEEDQAFARLADAVLHAMGKAFLICFVVQLLAVQSGKGVINHGCHCNGHVFPALSFGSIQISIESLWPSPDEKDRAIRAFREHFLFELAHFSEYHVSELSLGIKTVSIN
jgi:hypothetical protein